MKGVVMLYFLSLIFSCFLKGTIGVVEEEEEQVYIVYMGAASIEKNTHKSQLLLSLSNRHSALDGPQSERRKKPVHVYEHGISGFAARLSVAEAEEMAAKAGVVSVFPDPVLQLHTTRSWDFLSDEKDSDELVANANSDSNSTSPSSHGSDTIIGVIDTGIWPESESFSDAGLDAVPARWNGTCMEEPQSATSFCNKKVIGARFYNQIIYDTFSARDVMGHGTHVAAIAAGNEVRHASYYGLAMGTAKGGSPGSRIAVYSVCSPTGCYGSRILAGFDDAMADGVDVISISLGASSSSSRMNDYRYDPIAIGAFHAVENGITVVCSAGNNGPESATVVNDAPWILTVGASTIDRSFESDVVLGNKVAIKGEGINFSNLKKFPVHKMIDAKSAKNADAHESDARNCHQFSLEKKMVKGKIVLCHADQDDYAPVYDKKDEVQTQGGIGVVLVDDMTKTVASIYNEFPMTVVSSSDAAKIYPYINSTKNPVATILPTSSLIKHKPAPSVALFSSRGPSPISRNILKPDIVAPGVAVLAAWMGNDTLSAPAGKAPPDFNILSGTSMSCPHVTGIAAMVKSQNPTWSPSAIKSAIMTTASQTNNIGGPITTHEGATATAYDYGNGEVSATRPSNPGLIYETSHLDYLNFLCHSGYDLTTIKDISRAVPKHFSCPKDSSPDHISNINYPSIAVSVLGHNQSLTITRTVTTVAGGGVASTYTAAIDVHRARLRVQVIPKKLQFTKKKRNQQFSVTFTRSKNSDSVDVFGSITWINGVHQVRIPFVVAGKNSEK